MGRAVARDKTLVRGAGANDQAGGWFLRYDLAGRRGACQPMSAMGPAPEV